MRSFEISAREAGQRMDKYLRKMLSAASDGFIYKMLRKKNIVLNGKKASGSEMLKEGDEVRLYLSEETFAKFAPGASVSSASGTAGAEAPFDGETEDTVRAPDIDIVYENDDILIINKPAGLLSQKAKPEDDSANDKVIAYLLDSGQITREELLTFHPSVCNRLDRNTSGLLIAGKTMRGLQETAELLRGRDLKKYYHALVSGIVEEEQRLKGFLVKDETANTVSIIEIESESGGDPIETAWRPLSYYGNATLLEIDLITGKSHQIRAHLASIGHPILGDPKYGNANLNNALVKATGIRSQLLCACRMEFPDGLNVEIPDPKEFERAEEWLES